MSKNETAVTPGTILIVDDEANIRSGLCALLTRDGHDVREVGSAEAAISQLDSFACEVAIVDIRMPGQSGTDLLKQVRRKWPHISVILLTGQGTLETAMTAVREGALDYLLKPAQPDTIRRTVNQALIQARRRREQAQMVAAIRDSLERLSSLPPLPAAPRHDARPPHRLFVGQLTIDIQAHTVTCQDDPLPLTPSEFNLLVALASRLGEAISYTELVKQTLKYEADPWEAKELIKRHVFSLRQKIENDPSSPRHLLNVRGIGYRLVAPTRS